MSTLYWFRNDLRLHDNECLTLAVNTEKPFLLLYIFDPRQYMMLPLGFRKTAYLRYHFLLDTLEDLKNNIEDLGGKIMFRTGKPEDILPELIKKHQIEKLLFQKEIAAEEVQVEKRVESAIPTETVFQAIWGKTLYHIEDAPFEPKDTPKTSKAFRINLSKNADVRSLFPIPDSLAPSLSDADWGTYPDLSQLGFKENEIDQSLSFPYPGGETAALQRLQHYTFDTEQLTHYRWTRNRSLGKDYSSKFSPYMALGALSPRMIYWEVKKYEREVKKNASTWWIIFEIVWRDYFKYTALRVGNKMFFKGGIKDKEVEWKYDKALFERWCTGNTGIPFVDAHMRQLNETGFMSNRGRVNCSSFLTRDYEIDWRWGAAWFESKLLDYDVCSNWLNWNFQATELWYTNPVHQSLKYDKEMNFIKKWLPELKEVSSPLAMAPWLLPDNLKPDNYPPPQKVYKKWSRSIGRIQKFAEEKH